MHRRGLDDDAKKVVAAAGSVARARRLLGRSRFRASGALVLALAATGALVAVCSASAIIRNESFLAAMEALMPPSFTMRNTGTGILPGSTQRTAFAVETPSDGYEDMDDQIAAHQAAMAAAEARLGDVVWDPTPAPPGGQ